MTVDAPPRHLSTRGAAALAPARPVRPGRHAPAPVERRPHLRVVDPRERVRRRLTPRVGVIATGAFFVILLLVAVSHTVLAQGQMRLDALNADLRVEQARYQDLRTTVAELESPARIVAAAEELGMVTPDEVVYLQPQAAGPDAGADAPATTAGAASGPSSTWGTVKPLLETAP